MWLILIGVLISGLVSWQAAVYARDWALSRIAENGEDRLLSLVTQLRQRLDRYRFLPFLISQSPEVRQLLERPEGGLRDPVNRYLEQTGLVAGVTALFVLDREGRAVAYSQWREQRDFYLRSHANLPYFQQARNGEQGRYYTLQEPGSPPAFYLSAPIYGSGRFVGAAVVRIDLGRLGDSLALEGEYLLASESGEVILASRDDWLEQPLAWLLSGLRFETLGNGTRIGELREEHGRRLYQSVLLDDLRWHVAVLSDSSEVLRIARNAVLASLVGCLAAILLLLWLRERHLKNLSRRQTREALRRANSQLEEKVRVRTRELEQAQEALLQAGKLAALGRMSAAMVHQLNQPLTAFTTYLAICRQRLQRGETEAVEENLQQIDELAGRMRRITGELKLFAYRAPEDQGKCDLLQVLSRTLELFREGLERQGVELQCQIPEGSLVVRGEAIRLEQVLVNLIRNACDAMTGAERRLRIVLDPGEQSVWLHIRDTGPGVTPEVREHLFEPFFTTKPMGEGLGLGLAIVHSIVSDLGGEIRVESEPGVGCCFILRLPRSES